MRLELRHVTTTSMRLPQGVDYPPVINHPREILAKSRPRMPRRVHDWYARPNIVRAREKRGVRLKKAREKRRMLLVLSGKAAHLSDKNPLCIYYNTDTNAISSIFRKIQSQILVVHLISTHFETLHFDHRANETNIRLIRLPNIPRLQCSIRLVIRRLNRFE